MNISKQSLVFSVTNCIIQLSLIVSAYSSNSDGFAHFWTSCGFAYFLLAFGILTGIGSWDDMKYPFKATSDKLSRRGL